MDYQQPLCRLSYPQLPKTKDMLPVAMSVKRQRRRVGGTIKVIEPHQPQRVQEPFPILSFAPSPLHPTRLLIHLFAFVLSIAQKRPSLTRSHIFLPISICFQSKSYSKMPPTLHLVRHAEGFHNSAWHGEGIHDPLLTEKGEAQCAELCKNFPYHDKIDMLMAS